MTTSPAPAFIPLTVSWNLTQRCNLSCAHCYIDAGARADRDGELDPDETMRVLREIAEVNPQAVLILTGGEPLLRTDIYDVIRESRRIGFWTVLGSHGGLLGADVADKLIDAGLRGVGVSVDSVQATQHDKFRGISGAWAKTTSAMAVMRDKGLPFLVETTVTRFNKDKLGEMAAFTLNAGATALNVFFLVPTGRGANLNDLTPAEYEAALVDLARLQQEYEGKLLVNAKCAPHYRRALWERDPESKFVRTFHGGGCPAGTYYCRITPKGDVTPCPYMPLSVGNLREASFGTLWRTAPVLQQLREAQKGGRCGTCEFDELCGGCRCRAYATTGDVLAEDPSCTYVPGTHGGKAIPLPPERTYGSADAEELPWTEGARARVADVPFFARGMVKRAVEAAAKKRGAVLVTGELMQELREAMKSRFPLPAKR